MATTSVPHEPQRGPGRPADGAAARPGRPADGAAAARTEELYARYGRTVRGVCGALLRDPGEAEDAAQQTFLSAHRALRAGNVPREPAAWLATIARNECRGRIRTLMCEPLPTGELETVSLRDDPVAAALHRADLAALWSAIGALPVAQRDALLLREFGGLTYAELAEALDVSDAAVESLLFRARTRLRAVLRGAFASLTGASWLDALARAVAGGSAPAAAKVAALGVGAAVVGGGAAALVPHGVDRHVRLSLPARAAAVAPRRHASTTPAAPVRAQASLNEASPIRRRARPSHVASAPVVRGDEEGPPSEDDDRRGRGAGRHDDGGSPARAEDKGVLRRDEEGDDDRHGKRGHRHGVGPVVRAQVGLGHGGGRDGGHSGSGHGSEPVPSPEPPGRDD